MSKYSQKIESFLSHVEPSIKLTKQITDNVCIKNIYDSVLKAQKTPINIKITNQTLLKMIHTRDDYPLSYIFFKCLYEKDLLQRVLSHPPDITDLHTFMDWHRENIEHVNLDIIHRLMDSLIKDQYDKKKDDKKKELVYEFDNIDDTPHDIPLDELEKVTDQKMTEVFNKMFDVDIYEELITVYTLIFKPMGARKILHDAIYNNKFISIDVQYDIESVNLEHIECVINDKHKINMFIPEGKTRPDLKKIATTIMMMEHLAEMYNNNPIGIPLVDLTIIFSDQKKNVYHWTNMLCCDNINSGSTYPGKSIVCWRREEFQKVLIHELFHYYKFDFHSSDPYYQQLDSMIQVPKIIGSDMLNECYTESCTIIILIIYRYLMLNMDSDFKKYLKTELSFIMFQLGKIISIFGGDSFRDLVTEKTIIKQNTSFRSYFLLKLILLCNIDALLDVMNESMIVSNERLLAFGNLINSSWNDFLTDTNNIYIINTFIQQITHAYEKGDDRWIFKTCRMSVNDII